MKKFLGKLSKVIVLAVFILAVYLLYTKLRQYSLVEIRANMAQIPARQLALSGFFMLLNYTILVGYDWLAIKAIHKSLPLPKVCMVSFSGSVISNNFGALLGGSTIRYRLYTLWGFSGMDIVRLVLMLAVTYWIGAMGLAGMIFLLVPFQLPPELAEQGIRTSALKPFGAVLVLICATYLVVCRLADGRSIQILGKRFSLPGLRIAVAQTLVAWTDLVVAGACVYFLLPPNSGLSFLGFLPNYLAAQVTTVLSHVPGGIGVLDVILLSLTPQVPPDELFASLLVFRAIYYLIPLMAVAVLLGVYELRLRRRRMPEKSLASRRFRAWAPTLLAYAVFVAGTLICLSVMVPNSFRDLFSLYKFLPPKLVEAAHLLTGLCGVALLFLPSLLIGRNKMAWNWAVAALCLGILGNLGKGIDWPEALFLLCVLFPLLACRGMFRRIAPVWRAKLSGQWLVGGLLALAASFGLRFYVLGFWPQYQALLQNTRLATAPVALRTMVAQTLFAVVFVGFYLRQKAAELRKKRLMS